MATSEEVAKCLSDAARGVFYVSGEKNSEYTYVVSEGVKKNISETPYAEAYSAVLIQTLKRQNASEGYS